MLTVGNIDRNIFNSLTSSRMYFDKHFLLKIPENEITISDEIQIIRNPDLPGPFW